MIESFRHKGLKRYFEDDDASRLAPDMLRRIRLILTTLHAARTVEGINVPGFRLHPLKGDLKAFWSVTVSANWRIIFRFEGGTARDVDLVDYH
jgi:toxin HigB-1